MSSLREHALTAAYESVIAKASLRRPQHEAFEKFHNLVRALGRDLSAMTADEIAERVNDLGYSTEQPTDLLFDLATGVGKTRLMGSILVYLALARQTRNCIILAPRVAILDKFKRESDPTSDKYLLIDRSLIPSPNVCFRSDLLSFEPDPTKLNIFVLSPQTITGEDRRFATAGDFGPALKDYLKRVDDLVVLSDEAHHIGSGGFGAWRAAVGELLPKLHLGFTATIPKGSEKKVFYSYPLKVCLREGKYTKAVKLWVEPKPADIDDDAWDVQTIDFGLRRLEAKQAALTEVKAKRPGLPDVTPVLLVAARDIAHADRIALWLQKSRGMAPEEILVAHSGKKSGANERAIGQMVAIDRPGNRVRVVVNVFQLSEGWDVTNVWVIAPLRAMASFTNAIQTMGRGLRLPAGRRTGDEELDTLDVLCFGKEDFGTVVAQATREFGEGAEGSAIVGIATPGEHSARATKLFTIAVARNVSFSIPQVSRIPGEPELDFSPQLTKGISSYVEVYDVGSGERGSHDGTAVRRDFESVVRGATAHVVDSLRFLDPVRHTTAVEKIVRGVLLDLGGKPGMEISTDAFKLALGVMDAIRSRYRTAQSSYEATGNVTTLDFAPLEVQVPEEFDSLPSVSDVEKWQ